MKPCVKNMATVLGRAVLVVFSAVCALSFLALIVIKSVAYDRTLFVSAAEDSAYAEQLFSTVSSRLESECLFYGIEFPYVKDSLSKETVIELSKQYLGTLYDSLSTGQKAEELSVSSDLFLPSVDRFFASLGDYGNKIGAETRSEIAQALTTTLKETLHIIPYSEKATQLYPHTYGHPLLTYVNTALWLLGGLCVILLAVVFITDRKNPFVSLQRCVGSLWCASCVCYLPVALLQQAHLPSKLAFDGNLKALATALLDTLLTRMETIFGIVFWVLTALLLANSVWLFIRHTKSFSKKEITE